MRFDQRIEVQRTVTEVWGFLWDIERLARCLPSCKEVREVEPQQRYAVVIEERVGPFKARFEMDVSVVERVAEHPVRHLLFRDLDRAGSHQPAVECGATVGGDTAQLDQQVRELIGGRCLLGIAQEDTEARSVPRSAGAEAGAGRDRVVRGDRERFG